MFLHLVAMIITAILMPLVLYWFLESNVEALQQRAMRDQAESIADHLTTGSEGGWSLDLSTPICDRALFHLDNAYYIPAVHFTGRVGKTNVTSHTAFRGFGGPQGMMVIEEMLDRVARRVASPSAAAYAFPAQSTATLFSPRFLAFAASPSMK